MTVATGRRPVSFTQIRDDVAEVLGHVVYATMTTVDRRDAPAHGS